MTTLTLAGLLACQGNASSGSATADTSMAAVAATTTAIASAVTTPAASAVTTAVAGNPSGPAPFATYQARLAAWDHASGKGAPLTAPSEILQQDRANYHRYNKRDPEDQTGPVFVDLATREKMNVFLVPPAAAVANAIVHGTPLVQVSIFKADNGAYRVEVAVVSP